MSTILELLPGRADNAELGSVAPEKSFTGSALGADDEDWDDSTDSPTHRESSEAYADGVFPGYPLS